MLVNPEPIADKSRGFRLVSVQSIDAHDFEADRAGIENAKKQKGKPNTIVAHSHKGKRRVIHGKPGRLARCGSKNPRNVKRGWQNWTHILHRWIWKGNTPYGNTGERLKKTEGEQ